jgi:hypothetical protein
VISSVGRASPLQGEGRQFEPVITHHFLQFIISLFLRGVAQVFYVKKSIKIDFSKKQDQEPKGNAIQVLLIVFESFA